MTLDQCKPGVLVWAACGSYGWRPGVIQDVRANGAVRVHFQNGAWGTGARSPERLAPRDPALRGRDKPKPADAQRGYATQGPPAA